MSNPTVACARWSGGKCTAHAIRYCCKGDGRAAVATTALTTTRATTTTTLDFATSTIASSTVENPNTIIVFTVITNLSVQSNIPFEQKLTDHTSEEFNAAQLMVLQVRESKCVVKSFDFLQFITFIII